MPGTSGARGPGPAGPDSRDEDRSWAAGANEPDWPYPDHPSWPAGSTGRPLTPDHPSWPASGVGQPIGYGRHDGTPPDVPYRDHPSWPAGDVGRVASDDYPSWPAGGPGGRWAASAGRPPAGGAPHHELATEPVPAVHHDPFPRRPAPHVPPARGRHVRGPAGYGYPRPGVPADDIPQRWSAQLARNTGPIPQTYYDLAFGDGRLQVVLTETPGGDPGWAAGGGNTLQLPGPGTPDQAVSWDTGDHGNADSVRVAERILADADQQAAAIRQEATSQAVAIRDAAEWEAAEIRRQAAADTAPIREGAEREAAEIRQLAEAEAAVIREAAKRDAAALRAHLTAMAGEMTQVAAYVTENLTSPGLPAAPPLPQAGPHTLTTPVELPVEPGAGPAIEPVSRPARAPRTRPGARPATKGGAGRGAKPKIRQYKAMRLTSAATAALVVFAAVAGSAEIGLHGFKFFVFRAAGTGATNGDGLPENQGPGQPGAPGAHHKAQHQQAAKAKSHGKAHQQHGKAHQQHGKAHQQHGRAHQAKPAKKN